MGITPSVVEYQFQLEEFRKLSATSGEALHIPMLPRDRHVTDKKGFLIVVIVALISTPFLVYTLLSSDIRRLTHPLDDCGNLCGLKNSKTQGVNCSGRDHSAKPFLLVNFILETSACREECPPEYRENMGECYGSKDLLQFFSNGTHPEVNVKSFWWKFPAIITATIVLCGLMLLLFRFRPGVVVWVTIASGFTIMIFLDCCLWYTFSHMELTYRTALLTFTIVWTVITVVCVILVIVLFKKIRLMILLFKHAARTIFALPTLMMMPLMIAVCQLLFVGLAGLAILCLTTRADFHLTPEGKYEYVRNGFMTFTTFFILKLAIWIVHLFAGCQYMVTAGSIAHWYFARNRLYLDSPVWTSFTNTVRYHLGTVAFGSFILAFVAIIKLLVQLVGRCLRLRCLCDLCCSNIDTLCRLFTKNAYIETAIHGQSFFRSARRVAKLLMTNAASFVAINSVGHFVIGIVIFVVLTISTAIAYALFLDNASVTALTMISFAINLILIITVFGLFETVLDTLLICFCEDQCLNDGTTRPYFMSKDLMKFVEESKKIYKGPQ